MFNTAMEDIEQTFNTPMPVQYGGTGVGVVGDAPFPVRPPVTADNAVPRFDGTTGQLQASGVVISDANIVRSLGYEIQGAGQILPIGTTGLTYFTAGGDHVFGGVSFGVEFRVKAGGLSIVSAANVDRLTTIGYGAGVGFGHVFQSGNDTSNPAPLVFKNASSLVIGSVTQTSTATSYNTTSDYRLGWKSGAVDLSEPGEFIDALRPKFFPIADQAGFIAHEFAGVSPSSVSGTKDAVDEEGKPVWQSMQASSPDVMAHIVAELQSLRRRVKELEEE